MIRNEEVFLPSHEHVLALSKIAVCEISPLGLFGQRFPCRESRPMVYIGFLISTPCLVASLECVLGSDDFAFEKCSESRMVFGKACSKENVST